MSNLFSIFDPLILGFPLNWLAASLLILFIPQIYWMANNQSQSTFSLILNFVRGEFAAILGPIFNPGSLLITISLFAFIVMNNFPGLFSYVFTSSSHLTFTVSMALPLWIGHLFLAWIKTPQNMLAHLVPLGTPTPLTPFMVLIELVSNIIRPLTLSVRLAANMVAGHLLLTLTSSQSMNLNFILLFILMIGLTLLMVLESAVALIQAYVFSVLSTLYINEVNSFTLS